ncbi:hypothetical protein ALC57_10870, partial [Trachymyrmex cornetzi]
TTVIIVFPTIAITQRFLLLLSMPAPRAVQNGIALRELALFFLSFVDLHHPSRRLDRFRYRVTAFDHVSKVRNVIPGIIYTTDDVKPRS